jgi:hypothetical protein
MLDKSRQNHHKFWQYCIAKAPGPIMDCAEGLQPDLVQAVAVIQLFLAKWYEPPRSGELDYSTLVQQVLSVVVLCAWHYRSGC